jgi:hypothetical protein
MHSATLFAGIVIVIVALSVFYFSAAFSNLSLCFQISESSPASFVESDALCNPMNFAPHMLSFAVGIWLVIFGIWSRSAKPILTSRRFIYTVLAAGIAFWALLFFMFTVSALFDNSVSFAPPNPVITPFTANPLAIAALAGGLVLLALSGYVLKKSTNPARILMWVCALPAVAVTSSLLAGGNWWLVLGAVAAVIAAIVLLRKKAIPTIVVASVIVVSAAGIVLYYQTEELEGYYPEQTPDVFFISAPVSDHFAIEGTELTVVSNSSRTLGPECAADADCVRNYSEGLAELALLEGSDGRMRIISATISNNGVNTINVTQLQLTGLISADTGKPQYVEVEAIREPIFVGVVSSLMAPRQDLSEGSVLGPVTIQPGESLSAYIKGQWVPYSEHENSPFPFQAYVRYEYELEPLVRPAMQNANCIRECDSIRASMHKEYWDLSAGTHYTEITSLPVNILSLTSYSTEPSTRLSYAGCMSASDTRDLYSKRNATLGFPDYLPPGYAPVCTTENSSELVQIYANASAPIIKAYSEDDLRLISRDLGSKSGALAVTMRFAFEPDYFIRSASAEAQEINDRGEISGVEKAYIRDVEGGSIFVKVFDSKNVSVDLNLSDRQYHVFGGQLTEEELIMVAKSISRP